MFSSSILVTLLAFNAAAVSALDPVDSPKGSRRGETARKLVDTGKGKGKSGSFCGKAGKGKGNPPSLDAFCVEDDGVVCYGCGPLVTSISFASEVSIAAGSMFAGSAIGGLSGITYDSDLGVYYLLSDDMTTAGRQRFYVAEIDSATGTVTITDVRYFRRSQGSFAEGDLGPEGFAYKSPGTLIMASRGTPPAVYEFDLAGTLLRYFLVPLYYMPNSDSTFGVRDDLGFSGISMSPAEESIWVVTEGALSQDGPAPSDDSPARLMKIDYQTGVPSEEYVYYTDSGVTEIISMDDCGQVFLALERSVSATGNYTCKLYEVNTCSAVDQGGMETIIGLSTGTHSLPFPESETVDKTLLADFGADFGVTPGNCEGMKMTTDAMGSKTLIVVSDSETEDSQFLFINIETTF